MTGPVPVTYAEAALGSGGVGDGHRAGHGAAPSSAAASARGLLTLHVLVEYPIKQGGKDEQNRRPDPPVAAFFRASMEICVGTVRR
jgi:hypothetical protein